MDQAQRIETLRRELRDAVGDRAMAIYYIFRELREAMGGAEAVTLMRRALYAQGQAAGARIAQRMPPGATPMTPDSFAAAAPRMMPDEGALYPLRSCGGEGEGCHLQVTACPLKDRLIDWGVSPEDFETTTLIADAWSYGTIEALGLGYWSDTPKWGAEGCCRMHVTTPDDPSLAAHAHAHPRGG